MVAWTFRLLEQADHRGSAVARRGAKIERLEPIADMPLEGGGTAPERRLNAAGAHALAPALVRARAGGRRGHLACLAPNTARFLRRFRFFACFLTGAAS